MARTKIVGVAVAAAAVFAGTTATPAHAETHFCAAAFEDPTLSAVCGLVLRTVCSPAPPPHPICT